MSIHDVLLSVAEDVLVEKEPARPDHIEWAPELLVSSLALDGTHIPTTDDLSVSIYCNDPPLLIHLRQQDREFL
jgi:hypothetical protein